MSASPPFINLRRLPVKTYLSARKRRVLDKQLKRNTSDKVPNLSNEMRSEDASLGMGGSIWDEDIAPKKRKERTFGERKRAWQTYEDRPRRGEQSTKRGRYAP